MSKLSVCERIAAKTIPEPNSGCLLWIGACDNRFYGRMKVGRRSQFAHRVAWAEANGPIPSDLCVLHSCDNPACVNVRHLHLGTLSMNTREKVERGRDHNRSRSACVAGHPYSPKNTLLRHRTPSGEGHRVCRTCRMLAKREARKNGQQRQVRSAMRELNGTARLSPRDVETIRSLKGKESQRHLAVRFGVTQSTVWRVMHGINWSDK